MRDIPVLMGCGVGIDRVFEVAIGSLGQFIAGLVELPEVAIFREIPEPDTSVVGLPMPLMAIVAQGMRQSRRLRDIRREFAAEQRLPIRIGKISPSAIAPWAPDAARVLDQAVGRRNLKEWLAEIELAPRGHQDEFWRSMDLLVQLGALILEGGKREPLAVHRLRPEDGESGTPSLISTFSTTSVAPEVPSFLLHMESGAPEVGRTSNKSSWCLSEKVTLGTQEVFELPPDDDESSFVSRPSRARARRSHHRSSEEPAVVFSPLADPDSTSLSSEPETVVSGTYRRAGLDDYGEVFALPPDEDEDQESESQPAGTGLDDHGEVFALPPDEDEESESPPISEPIDRTVVKDDDSQHVVRPMFRPRYREK
jgi:hypothetical protein